MERIIAGYALFAPFFAGARAREQKPLRREMGVLENRPRNATARMRYVYTGNVHDRAGGSTWCHGCGALLIGRDWFDLSRWRLDEDGCCMDCGTPLPDLFERRPGSWGRQRQPARLQQ